MSISNVKCNMRWEIPGFVIDLDIAHLPHYKNCDNMYNCRDRKIEKIARAALLSASYYLGSRQQCLRKHLIPDSIPFMNPISIPSRLGNFVFAIL